MRVSLANTPLSVPKLDKKKVRRGDWFFFLTHGKDSKSQKIPEVAVLAR